MTRHEVLKQAVNGCLKELYSYTVPHIKWDDFVAENQAYSKKYKAWERFNYLKNKENLSEDELKEFSMFPGNWEGKSITECIGPRPFEFYYLPKEILKDICDNYIYAYNIDSQQELLNTIQILKEYCRKPIVDKYIDEHTDENGNWHPGHRSYDNPDNLEKEITKILGPEVEDNPYHVHKICDKFFEFLDMAGNFYNWNRDLNSFNMSVYLGPSPNSSKESVIKNWKEYKGQDIEINDEQIKKEYYGEDYDEEEVF